MGCERRHLPRVNSHRGGDAGGHETNTKSMKYLARDKLQGSEHGLAKSPQIQPRKPDIHGKFMPNTETSKLPLLLISLIFK